MGVASRRDAVAAEIPRLRRYARALLGDDGEADDLIQDTLERALARLEQWRDGENPRKWLFSILHNSTWMDCDASRGGRRTSVSTMSAWSTRRRQPMAPADATRPSSAAVERRAAAGGSAGRTGGSELCGDRRGAGDSRRYGDVAAGTGATDCVRCWTTTATRTAAPRCGG